MADVSLILSLQAVNVISDCLGGSDCQSPLLHDGDEDRECAPPSDDQVNRDDVTDLRDPTLGAAEDSDGVIGRKKKHRRGKSKKRKWKPYNKLTWEEKRELEDRETRRAHRIREERFAHGQPVAPYNTTQFLMEDHNVKEPDLENVPNGHRQHRESTGTAIDSEEYYSSPEDEEEFLQKEFCEVYDNIHAERLSSMSKLELIQEYIQLEDRVDKLEHKLGVAGREEGEVEVSAENLEKIRIFHQEMRKLTEENDRLRRENELLRDGVGRRVESVDQAETEGDPVGMVISDSDGAAATNEDIPSII